MAGRFDDGDDRAYYHTQSGLNAIHNRAQSVQVSRSDHRTPRAFDHVRRRSYPARAFVEDEASALAREYNPTLTDSSPSISTDEEPKYRGSVDQVPLFDPVPENNPERRFVIIPKTPDGTQTNASADREKPPERKSEYEANTCRKFTVPRVDGDSVSPNGPGAAATAAGTGTAGAGTSVAAAAAATTTESTTKAVATAAGATVGAAAAAAAVAAAAAAGKTAASTTQPTIQRRKSRLDLPRIDTDVEADGISGPPRPKSSAHTDHRSSDHHRQTDHDRLEERHSAFLSPSVTKHATKGRDRTYYGQESSSDFVPRARSGDTRLSEDRRARGASPDTKYRRRSSSFNDTEKPLRRLSINRLPRDEVSGPRARRNSPSPSPKDRRTQGASPTRERERERERDRDRDRDRERERERERDRPRDRDRHDHDSDRDRRGLSRRDSTHRKHRDQLGRSENGYSSEDKAKSASTPSLRRQPSERRKGVHKDDDVPLKVNLNGSDTRRIAAAGMYRSAGATPISTPRISQTQIPLVVGAVAGEVFERAESSPPRSPTRSQREERKKNEDRKYGSSSASSSPEGLATAADADRPRGPRQARMPNVIHNSMGSYDSRAGALPMPTPISAAIPLRGHSSVRARDESRHHERPRSPVDAHRIRGPQLANSARASGIFEYSTSSQTGRTPAFYVSIPSGPLEDRLQARLPEHSLDWQYESQPGRPLERQSEPILHTYRHHLDDLPDCPRQTFSSRHHDWRALVQFPDFYVCPSCYEAAFANSPYRNEFVPTPIYNREARVRCTFGSLYWYKVALYLNNKYQLPSLSLIKILFERDEQLQIPCPGSRRVIGDWMTILDPFTGKPVPKFSVCQQCSTAVRILFPWLRGLLQSADPYSRDVSEVCALYYEPDRKRLWRYIEVLEKSNDLAETTKSPPDVEGIVNKLLAINYTEECKRDIPVRGRKWYWMRSLPDFIVCEECFDESVYPLVNMYRTVAGDFYKEPKEVSVAACHLYSPRMRGIFLEACKRNNKDYLEAKLEERDQIAKEVTDRLKRLPKLDPMEEDRETSQLLETWKKWE